ncbi:MAG: thioesterase family protein [Campylobacterota bacterium]|nr:thioesterase family protein [Campylobacterota bacterium]
MQIRIYYEDTDMGGIVYHTNYIKYCERARSEFFFAKESSPTQNGCHFVVKNIQCDFIASARLGDVIEVKSTLLSSKAASAVLNQSIYLQEKKIFDMEILLVFVCGEGKISKIPTHLKEMFSSF